jgi:lipopolysaccharide/colanic/teichoic acid biosynthesis glycosyltransferase
MRIPSPASRGAFRLRFGFFDSAWVILSPVFALYLSNAYVLSSADGIWTVGLYCAVSAASAAASFLIFRIQDGMPRYFSVYDAIEVSKAVVVAELVACIVLFSITRLEGIPRSAPIVHAMILAAGLITARVMARILSDDRHTSVTGAITPECVVMIGSNQFSSLYIKLMKVRKPVQQRVVGILDNRPKLLGRLLDGVRIVGALQHIEALIDEYLVHGVKVDRIVIGGGPDLLSEEELTQVRRVCVARRIKLDFVPHLFGLAETRPSSHASDQSYPAGSRSEPAGGLIPSSYFRFKPLIDFCASLTLIIMLLPIILIVSAMVLVDVGSPVLFWQQRLGLRGRNFLLYKFRTLRPPFDGRGDEIAPDKRLSWIGHLLRDTSLDELPQLLNVLVGDMSLIGPRPLLPEDQPVNYAGRLLVRPGITGWAQVNGGKLLTAEEKVKLDEWYVRNASPLVDIKLVWTTLQIVLLGARRSNEAVVDAGKDAPLEHWQNLRVVKTDRR